MLTNSGIEVPSVTEDDLYAFHRTHFSVDTSPDSSTIHTSHTHVQHDDEDLGCYPDGVKRTLTDQQVAMFRHSEIQTLLRERRRQREDQEDTDSTDRKSPTGSEKRRRSASASDGKRKWQRYIDASESNPEHLTHRRMARELDEQKTASFDLAYGEEEPSKRPRSTVASSSGRKQVAYGDSEDSDSFNGSSKNEEKNSTFKWPTLEPRG